MQIDKKALSHLTTEIEIKVPFYDLDPMNVVWHGNYVKYFEKARCALLEKYDYDYVQMRDSGYMWPIIDMRLKYVNYASFGQVVKCRATITEVENRLKIEYLIYCPESGKRLTKGYTMQVAVDLETMEMQLVSPSVLKERLGVNCA
ncbi:thioesterase family protein [Aliikangiella sp. G2MR2-5]|uniref:acyl-CoA thioesterase n=1 Tax=Aliikangiella sp. G2MR2-5 TaxID=2788943 RepID=UPI0018AABCDD|nr:thioesterase family protein [Aliikangiella sp. G2MR2-5]